MSLSLLAHASNNLAFVRVAVIIGAGMWGLFWIPLRSLGDNGIGPAWSTILFYLVPFMLCLPVAAHRWQSIFRGGRNLIVIAFFMGLAMVFYANAYFFTDVVRVLLLYYLLPVWGTLFGCIFLGEPITRLRIFSIILGFAGLLVIFGVGEEIPWPANIGDWMALSAGFLWAFASLLAKSDTSCHAVDTTILFFGWAAVVGLGSLLLPQFSGEVIPNTSQISAILPWMVAVAIVLIIPTCFVCIWGAGILSPGHIGILYLSEISVGVVAAALLTDEVFGLRELTGVLLISSAGLCEAFGHRDASVDQTV